MCATSAGVTPITVARWIQKKYLEAAMRIGSGQGTYLIDGDEWARFMREVHPLLKSGRPHKGTTKVPKSRMRG
jgi:hypothetical protein